MKWEKRILMGLPVLCFATEASACPESRPPWENGTTCEVLAPKAAAVEGDRFSWSRASHDERRDYLVKAHVPYALANRLAIGGIPLQGQARASDTGWFLVPSVVPRALFVFE